MVLFNPSMPNSFEIVVGTYEQYLLGYKVENIVNEHKVEKSFATHDHLGSIRSIASNKHYLASAGADDSVYIYDMRHRLESGRLMHHNGKRCYITLWSTSDTGINKGQDGKLYLHHFNLSLDTVNCVTFTPEASHLFTCSNDGSIAAVHCGNWQLEKHWQQAHKGFAVNTFAIHPTGKIGLSTGGDGVLRTWNLVKGRQAYATNLVPRLKLDAKSVNVLKWSPNGEKYLLAANQIVDVYSVDLAGIDNEIKFDSKVICVEFLRDDLIAVGFENGKIAFYDLDKSLQTVDIDAHNVRVKCMTCIRDLLVSASSSGEIKLWKFTRDEMHMLHSINCDVRITCLTIALPCKSFKRVEEVKIEGENTVKKSNKFSLKQEVIVEQEGDWDVTNIEATKKKPSKELKKKKRKVNANEDAIKIKKKRREIGTDNTECSESPKKKKKLTTDSESKNAFSKRRKKRAVEESKVSELPLKKKKKSTTQNAKLDTVCLKTGKSKLKVTNDTGVLPKKRKRKTVTKDSKSLLKKKGKIQ